MSNITIPPKHINLLLDGGFIRIVELIDDKNGTLWAGVRRNNTGAMEWYNVESIDGASCNTGFNLRLDRPNGVRIWGC